LWFHGWVCALSFGRILNFAKYSLQAQIEDLMHLVLIETSGNQRYIFATNKLRENVGASELTYRVGTEWVLDAHDALKHLWPGTNNTNDLRKNLLNQNPIGTAGVYVEVIVATSGKAMLLVNNREDGKAIITSVTRRTLAQAPGIDVCGAISDPFELNEKPLGEVVRDVHRKLARIRDNRPGAALRFLRLPVVMECATSGLPAAIWAKPEGGEESEAAHSAITREKRRNRGSYNDRMSVLLRQYGIKNDFAKNVGVLEKYCDWLAVVHADGNGVGQIFRHFWRHSGCEERSEQGEPLESVNRAFLDDYRRFSIALDVCTERAFISALVELQDSKEELRSLRRVSEEQADVLPILPIVLGGDDLTIVCDGQGALQFTRHFLAEFEAQTALLTIDDDDELQTALKEIIPRIAETAFGVHNLSACAGIAIVKPHFPFSAAYELSEQLVRSAKIVSKGLGGEQKSYPCSALDFHVLYDTSGSDLLRIRRKLQRDHGRTWLYARPYVVTPQALLSLGIEQKEWARNHDWEQLKTRVVALLVKDNDGRRCLPNSQLHDLRGGLFLGREGADARYQLIRGRYQGQGIAAFDEGGTSSLFFSDEIQEGGIAKTVSRTRLLDALDAANFWINKTQRNGDETEDAQ
jgi:hypothetical protein